MTRPSRLEAEVLRRKAADAPKTVHVAAKKRQEKDAEAIQLKQRRETAVRFQQAIALRARPSKRDRYAPLIDKLTDRIEETMIAYGQDNLWSTDDMMDVLSLSKFLLSVDQIEVAPEVPEYVETTVWRHFCGALLDLANLNTPVPARYLNGMRQDKYVPAMTEVVQTRENRQAWVSRRANEARPLGELYPKSPPPKKVASKAVPNQPETPKQRRSRVRNQAKQPRPLSLSAGK